MEIVKIDPIIPSPQQRTSRNAGWEFPYRAPVFLRPVATRNMEIDKGTIWYGMYNGVFVLGGVFDEDYHGEIIVILINIRQEKWVIDAQNFCELMDGEYTGEKTDDGIKLGEKIDLEVLILQNMVILCCGKKSVFMVNLRESNFLLTSILFSSGIQLI